MKIVVNETQYKRIFNKTKTKLVITESQFNQLLVESNMASSLSKVAPGDAVKITKGNGDILHFRVIDGFQGHITMINCNNGVFKNSYFFITSNDLQDGSLSYKYEHADNIKDKDNIKDNLKSWRDGTFKGIQGFEVFKGSGGDLTCNLNNASEPKFNINTDTGNVAEPEPEEEEREIPTTEREILLELMSYKNDESLVLKLQGGTDLKMTVTGKDHKYITYEFMSASGPEGDRYVKLIGDVIELENDDKNIKVKDDDDEEGSGLVFDLRMSRYLPGQGDSGKVEKEDFIIHDIEDFSEGEMYDKEEGDLGTSDLTDEEIEAIIKKYSTDNDILRDAIYKKPNSFLELFGVAKARGIVPAENIIARKADEYISDALITKEFPAGKVLVSEFIKLTILSDKHGDKLRAMQGNKFKSKVKKRASQSEGTELLTNLKKELNRNDTYLYKIYINEELESTDKFNIYSVDMAYSQRKGKYEDVASGKLQIYKSEK